MRRAWKAAASAATMIAALGACITGRLVDLNDSVVERLNRTDGRADNLDDFDDIDEYAGHDLASTTTTLAPTTTAVPVDAQVKADFLALYDAYWTCLRSPKDCDPTKLTASVGPARAALTKTVNDLVTGGLFAGTEDPGYVVVQSIIVAGPTTATVTYCAWDTGVLYGPPAKPGGAPVVVNNLQVTSRFETTMVLEGGRWLTSEEKRTERVEEEPVSARGLIAVSVVVAMLGAPTNHACRDSRWPGRRRDRLGRVVGRGEWPGRRCHAARRNELRALGSGSQPITGGRSTRHRHGPAGRLGCRVDALLPNLHRHRPVRLGAGPSARRSRSAGVRRSDQEAAEADAGAVA